MAASYQAPEGWLNWEWTQPLNPGRFSEASPFWEVYANQYAADGSENQLIAGLSHSVPESFLREYFVKNGYKDSPKLDYLIEQQKKLAMKDSASPKGGMASDPSTYMSKYSQALQKRLSSDFKKNMGEYSARGKANLRDQSQQLLDNDFGQIDENANSRGLLYSGKRQSARAGAAANRASELGTATTAFEQNLGDTDRKLSQASYASDINSLLQQQDLNSIASGAFYNKLQQDAANSAAMIGGLGQLGAGVGMMTGATTAKGKS